MIVLTRHEGELATGDALLAVHLRQVNACCQYLRELANNRELRRQNEIVEQAAQVCEMSRDLLFRLNRVHVSQIKEIVKVFTSSVTTLRSLESSDRETAKLIDSYAWHIQKRINLLEREIQPFSSASE